MTATFLLNSGRVSTQSIFDSISKSDFDGTVHHEAIGARFRPASALRDASRIERIATNDATVSAYLRDIDDMLEQGTRYVSVGWTCFSWANYFQERWGDKVRFSALVRCPYQTAASLMTHGFFMDRDDMYSRHAIIKRIHNVHYTEIAADYPEFSVFEKLVFHWMELYRYVLEFREVRDFKVWKFEDIRASDAAWDAFIQSLCRSQQAVSRANKTDRFKFLLPADVTFTLGDELASECRTLCVELGYDAAFVDGLDDRLAQLPARYLKSA